MVLSCQPLTSPLTTALAVVGVRPAATKRQLVDERRREHVRRIALRDHVIPVPLERRDDPGDAAPRVCVPLRVAGPTLHQVRERVRHQRVDALRELPLELHLHRVVQRLAVGLVLALKVVAVLREGPECLCDRRVAADHLLHPAGIGQRHAVEARLPRLELVVEPGPERQVARVNRVQRIDARGHPAAGGPDVRHAHRELVAELAIHRDVPLVRCTDARCHRCCGSRCSARSCSRT